jgi:hypothetical protein
MHEIIIQMLDGTEERYQTASNIGISPGVLMIDQGNGSHIAIAIAQIKRWEFKAGRIAMANATPPGVRPVQ